MDLAADCLQNRMLRFEPLAEHHRDEIASEDIEASLWRWMPALSGGTNFDSYFDFLLLGQKKGLSAVFVLRRQADDAYAGLTGLNQFSKTHRRLRSALAWHPPAIATLELYQCGQMVMIECAIAWGARRIEWYANPLNTFIMDGLASLHVTQEAVLRQYERMADGAWADKVVFSLIRDEMKDTVARLKAELSL